MKWLFLYLLFFLTRSLSLSANFEQLMGKETSRWRFVSTEGDLKALERYRAVYEREKHHEEDGDQPVRIPQQVHLIWLGPKPFPRESVENLRMWIAKHPDWHFHFWTDRLRPPPVNGVEIHTIEELKFERLADYYKISSNWGQKSDILRYEILNQMGGIYIDHDASCLQSFENLTRGFDFFCCLEVPHTRVDGRSVTAGIGIIGTVQRHPLIATAIQSVIDNWDAAVKLYPTTSPTSVREFVMHSTYLALTRALEQDLEREGWRNIVFPASYFYPQKGLKAIFSHHFYGTSWADIGGENEMERSIRLGYSAIIKEQKTLLLGLLGVLFLSLFGVILGVWRCVRF